MNSFPDIDFSDFPRHFNAELSKEKSDRIDLWIKQNPENQAVFDEIIDTWLLSGLKKDPAITTHFEAVKPLALERINAKIDQLETSDKIVEPARATSVISMYYKVAAVLVVSIGLYYCYQLLQPQSEQFNTLGMVNEKIILSDGSQVDLNAESSIRLINGPLSSKREVVFSGEGFFDVKHADKPFIISTNDIEITVTGTLFNVKTNADQQTSVYLKEGGVRIRSFASNETFVLTPGDYYSNGVITNINDDPTIINELFWHTKELVFEHTKLEEVFRTIEDVYNINISVQEKSILDCNITVEFEEATPLMAMKVIAKTHKLGFTVQGNSTYVLSGKGCSQ